MVFNISSVRAIIHKWKTLKIVASPAASETTATLNVKVRHSRIRRFSRKRRFSTILSLKTKKAQLKFEKLHSNLKLPTRTSDIKKWNRCRDVDVHKNEKIPNIHVEKWPKVFKIRQEVKLRAD